MSKIYFKLILLFLLLTSKTVVNAQFLADVKKSFANHKQNVFQEKIFVHTDKEQYLTGEILWFKVYNVDAATNKLNDLSKVAYIELLDQQNKPVVQSKVALSAGLANGSISIPVNLANGYYTLRVYTNWMKNWGTKQFFEKKMVVFNALNSKTNSFPKSEIDLQFFPEGGDMIEGLPTNVGFKALDALGKGIDVNGAIINQKNDTIAKFKSLKFGIGKFAFTPLANQVYTVIATSSKKEIISKQLPIAKKQGYTLALKDNESISVNVSTNLNENKIYLIVHSESKISIAEEANFVAGKALFIIDKSKLSEGLSYLTIFNENGKAVCERLYFKKGTKKIKIEANSDAKLYDVRKPVNVNFNINSDKEREMKGSFSISVRRIDSLQGLDEGNILSYLLLSSELKGNIESPGYYFENDDKNTNEALDNLLITQGWRRFSWDSVRQKSTIAYQFLPEINGHLIAGKIKNKDGIPVDKSKLYLSIPIAKNQFYEAISDEKGDFIFNTRDINGLNEVVVEAADTTSLITITNPFYEQFSTNHLNTDLAVNDKLFTQLQEYSLATQIQNVFSADKLKNFSALTVDTSMFYGKPFKTYKLNDYTRFRTIEETLREYVTQTFVTKSANYKIRLLGNDVSLNGNPLVLLDGVPYFDMNKVMKIDPYKLERIEILPELYYFGSSAYEGVLSFFSFKPNLSNIEINSNAIVLDYEGMQQQREFYSPSYNTALEINSRTPDFRNVIYWSPNLNVNQNGVGQFKFYTSDFSGTYIGIINGLTADGVPATSTFTFQVKER